MQTPQQMESGSELLSRYAREPALFFTSPRTTLLTRGEGERLFAEEGETLGACARRALAAAASEGSGRPMLVGALPFDLSVAPRLSLHKSVEVAAPIDAAGKHGVRAGRASVRTHQVRMVPAPSAYREAVARAIAQMKAGALQKVVLSRALEIETVERLDLARLVRRLLEQNPSKYVFSCDLGNGERARRILIGASPELLVAKHGAEVISHPLAGSAPRSADQAEDAERARVLSCCPKNRREHALVVEAVADGLAPFCDDLTVPREPSLLQTASMWHLGTRVVGRLRSPEVSSLELATVLHPTPALCGAPREQARALIGELEGFEREFFGGAVGYCDAEGDGEWAVTIRCAEARERTLRLYAGAGIVAESTPEAELEETTAKLNTMLRALGIDHLRQVL